VNGLRDIPFHDAEIRSMHLHRDGPTIELDVEVFAQTQQARMVRLRFGGVSNLELRDFNEQNVLFDLKLDPSDDGFCDVQLWSSYGLSGAFRCASLAAEELGSPERGPLESPH
jgi:hypothetical protein